MDETKPPETAPSLPILHIDFHGHDVTQEEVNELLERVHRFEATTTSGKHVTFFLRPGLLSRQLAKAEARQKLLQTLGAAVMEEMGLLSLLSALGGGNGQRA